MRLAALVGLADVATKKTKGKGAASAAPKVERIVIAHKKWVSLSTTGIQSGDKPLRIPLVEQELELLRQFQKMAESDDPGLRAKGQELLREVVKKSAKATLSSAQRQGASASAAIERQAEATPHKSLARELANQVSPLITRQGKKPTARAVKRAAAELQPQTPASQRLVSLSVEQVVNLIFKPTGN